MNNLSETKKLIREAILYDSMEQEPETFAGRLLKFEAVIKYSENIRSGNLREQIVTSWAERLNLTPETILNGKKPTGFGNEKRENMAKNLAAAIELTR